MTDEMSPENSAYDVVITGGHVIDPANNVSRVADVAIRDGVIAAVEDGIGADQARRHIDATGQYVTPGLVDLHTHIYWGVTYWGIDADPVAARTGVTTWLDVGSAGGYTFPGFREYIVERTKSKVYALLNLSSIGLVAPSWEFANLDYLDLDLAVGTVERNRDIILGIKARIDSRTTRGTGILPMQKARELADLVGLPLMTHIGTTPPSLDEVAEYLRPGDILTHCFTGQDMRVIDVDGKVNPQIKALKDQGMVLDVGHGTGSFSYEVAEAMLEQGIPPDVISSDIHQTAVQGPMFDLPTTLSKFLNLGMPIDDVIACATINAARAVRLDHVGKIGVGDTADVAVFRLDDGDFEFHDIAMEARAGSKLLVNTATLLDGHELPRQRERELQFWAKVPEVQRGAVRPGGPVDVEPVDDPEEVMDELYRGSGS
ncbi:MAG: amidohydrolase/deacetylase family metallohydrolase [Chloroflexota bacterium]|nr:amidohydrolase/deacetylase family metallohydrolase [Chloroflexota bacterium]